MQIRVGTKIGNRKTVYHVWNMRDLGSLNAAKKANGLNSTTAPAFPAQAETRRIGERRVAVVEVKEELRRVNRRVMA